MLRDSTPRYVGPSVGWSFGRSVGWSVMLSSNLAKSGILRILNDLGSAGRGRKRDKEEGGTKRNGGRGGMRRRNEGLRGIRDEERRRGGGRSEEEGAMRRVKKL